jgi:hypothetical protein
MARRNSSTADPVYAAVTPGFIYSCRLRVVKLTRISPCAADVTEGLTAHFVEQYEQVYDLAFNYDEDVVEAREADSSEEALLEAAPQTEAIPQAVPQAQTAGPSVGWAAAARPASWAFRQRHSAHVGA